MQRGLPGLTVGVGNMCRVCQKKSCSSAICFTDEEEEEQEKEEEEKEVRASGCVDAAANRRRSAGRRNAEDQVSLPGGECGVLTPSCFQLFQVCPNNSPFFPTTHISKFNISLDGMKLETRVLLQTSCR